MEDTETKVTLENHSLRINNLEKQVSELKVISNSLQELTISVKELIINMQNMVDEQKEQGIRIKALETLPTDNWNTAKKTVLTTSISTVAAAVVVGLLILAANYFK